MNTQAISPCRNMPIGIKYYQTQGEIFMFTNISIDKNKTLPIACVIMASGLGNRFGENKLLYKIQDKPLLQYILETTAKLPFTERIVVTRHQEIVELCESQNIKTIFHQEPYQSDTVRIALEKLPEFKGYLFCTGDQPFLKATSLEKLCASFLEAPNFIHRTIFENTPCNPVIFPAKFKGELLNFYIIEDTMQINLFDKCF